MIRMERSRSLLLSLRFSSVLCTVAFAALPSEAYAQQGDCCQLTPEVAGCSVTACQDCICEFQPDCCTREWYGECRMLAERGYCGAGTGLEGPCLELDDVGLCQEECGHCPDRGSCCCPNGTPGCIDASCETCVCERLPSCCESEWTAECVAMGDAECSRQCSNSADDFNCPGTGSCCCDNGSPGCGNSECRDCVCASRPECCSGSWDDSCADLAAGDCLESCIECDVCGNGYCGFNENCALCPEDCGAPCEGSCCERHSTSGCDESACQDCVCELESACCSAGFSGSWENICVGTAEGACADVCTCTATCGDGVCEGLESCLSCVDDCGACTNDCCSDGSGPGCNDLDCQECVCAIAEGDCCNPHYDWQSEHCGRHARGECADVCECAQTCGNGECDPYETCVSCPDDCGDCVGECCREKVPNTPGCELITCQDCVCEDLPDCCEPQSAFGGWRLPCAEYARSDCSEACGCGICGDGVCQIQEHCESCPEDCTECDDDCCRIQNDHGCGDPVCETAVCESVEGFFGGCCSGPWSWDYYCAERAYELTAYTGECACDTGSDADCCSSHAEVGCSDHDCEMCVCANDIGCCYSEWNEHCVEIARERCECAGCVTCGDGACARSENGCNCPEDCSEECSTDDEGDEGCGGCATAPSSSPRPWVFLAVLAFLMFRLRRR